MRRIVLCACLAVFAAGCKSEPKVEPKPEPPKPVVTAPDPAPPKPAEPVAPAVEDSADKDLPVEQKLGSLETLGGSKLAETTQGPWVVRTGGASAGSIGGPGGGGSGMAKGGLAAPRAAMAKEMTAGGMRPVPSAPAAAPARADEGMVEGKAAPPGAPMPQLAEAPPLRAGSTDDNAEFEEFVKFLASWSDRPTTAGKANLLDVRDRRFVRVLDSKGNAVPMAQVSIVDEAKDRAVWTARTYGDGRAPFYPRVVAAPGKVLVEASSGGKRVRADWDGKADLDLKLDGPRQLAGAIQLDVLFAIDTTGSMQDEIDRIKDSLFAVTQRLRGLKQEFDLRYGAVLFRDVGDEYVTSTYPFTSDIEAFSAALQSVRAAGGGDMPESVNQALAHALRAPWRPDAAKIVFLVGDAPPHMDYQGDVGYGQSIKAAVARGVRMHSIAASGLDQFGTLVWRQVAQFTRGKFIFIEYGSAAATAAKHGVTGDVKSNNLDDIVYEQIRDELAYWGKDGPAPNVASK